VVVTNHGNSIYYGLNLPRALTCVEKEMKENGESARISARKILCLAFGTTGVPVETHGYLGKSDQSDLTVAKN
jgi:hypothetical protein